MSVSTLTLNDPFLNIAGARRKLARAVSKSTDECREAVRQEIIKSKPAGKIYRRAKVSSVASRRGEHQASRRGQAPAIDSGNLLNSIQDGRTGEFSGEVVVSADYAEVLENQMDRKFVEPAAKKYETKFYRNVEKSLK